MSLPALRALRRRFPEAHIAIQARPWVADLYAREPFCDEIIAHTVARGARDWSGKWRLARTIRKGGYECAILLQNAFEAALITALAGVPRRIGYDRDGRRFLLTDAVAVPRRGEIPEHESFYYLELLRRAGLIDRLPEDEPICLDGAAAARETGARRLKQCGLVGPVVGVSPGAAYGSAKRWLPERFAETATKLARERSGSVAIFGSKDERELCESVAGEVRRAGVAVHDFAGETSLAEFIELAAACIVVLTNDSGAMHVASALGIPTVAVFGSTDHVATGPTGPLARIVREPVECSPCLLRECPIDHRCMTRVTSERVAETAAALLTQR